MDKLFNQTFFKFLFGFILIIVSSFIMITIAGHYADKSQVANTVSNEAVENQ